jgi:hypothetical protein
MAGVHLPLWLGGRVVSEFMTYATIAYEALFILILIPRLRLVFALIGIALHLGIAVFLPLTYFGLIMTAPLLLFLGPIEFPKGKFTVYAKLCMAYCLIIVAAYSIMKYENSRANFLVYATGVHPTGVYADFVFKVPQPILRMEISTTNGPKELPSFGSDGYPTVRDRMWKVYAFFLRIAPCNLGDFSRYALQYKNLCDTLACRIEFQAKNVAVTKLEYAPETIDELKARPWISVGELRWSPIDSRQRIEWVPASGLSQFGPRFLSTCESM